MLGPYPHTFLRTECHDRSLITPAPEATWEPLTTPVDLSLGLLLLLPPGQHGCLFPPSAQEASQPPPGHRVRNRLPLALTC